MSKPAREYIGYLEALSEVGRFRYDLVREVFDEWEESRSRADEDRTTGLAILLTERASVLLEELGALAAAMKLPPGDRWKLINDYNLGVLRGLFEGLADGSQLATSHLPLPTRSSLLASERRDSRARALVNLLDVTIQELNGQAMTCAQAWMNIGPIAKAIQHGFKVVGERQAAKAMHYRENADPSVPSPWILVLNSTHDAEERLIETTPTTVPVGEAFIRGVEGACFLASRLIELFSEASLREIRGEAPELPKVFLNRLPVSDQIAILQ